MKMSDVNIFCDDKGKQTGFSGNVDIYNESIFIDTRNGTGYNKMIKMLDPMICKFSKKYKYLGDSIEDIKQNIIVHILEGVIKYDYKKDTKLSTFIEMYLCCRMINDLRNLNTINKNATTLSLYSYSVTCKCGAKFIIMAGTKDLINERCVSCDDVIDINCKKMSLHIPEINESNFKGGFDGDDSNFLSEYADPHGNNEDNIIFAHDLKNILLNKDNKTNRVIDMYCFNDKSKSDITRDSGLSKVYVRNKLKKFSKDRRLRKLLDR